MALGATHLYPHAPVWLWMNLGVALTGVTLLYGLLVRVIKIVFCVCVCVFGLRLAH